MLLDPGDPSAQIREESCPRSRCLDAGTHTAPKTGPKTGPDRDTGPDISRSICTILGPIDTASIDLRLASLLGKRSIEGVQVVLWHDTPSLVGLTWLRANSIASIGHGLIHFLFLRKIPILVKNKMRFDRNQPPSAS